VHDGCSKHLGIEWHVSANLPDSIHLRHGHQSARNFRKPC
jgi:hypothetical protein